MLHKHPCAGRSETNEMINARETRHGYTTIQIHPFAPSLPALRYMEQPYILTRTYTQSLVHCVYTLCFN